MGRKAGVAPEETKAVLLQSAAAVFARRGYDGASIAEITTEAGLTSGAVYAHYASKAELFVATLQTHGADEIDRLLGSVTPAEVLEVVALIGASFDRREPAEGSLLVAAIVAAQHDREVAKLLRDHVGARERFLATLIGAGQVAGSVTDEVTAASIARLSTMVALGSVLVGTLGLNLPQHEDWARTVARVVDAFRDY